MNDLRDPAIRFPKFAFTPLMLQEYINGHCMCGCGQIPALVLEGDGTHRNYFMRGHQARIPRKKVQMRESA